MTIIEETTDAGTFVRKHVKSDKLHRVDGPAYVEWWDKDEKLIRKVCYYQNGKLHNRSSNPTELVWNRSGILIQRRHHKHGKLHGHCEEWYDNGQIKTSKYYSNGRLHRNDDDGPAKESWYINGQIKKRAYYKEGKIHRDGDGSPALEVWFENGQLMSRSYYLNGKYHHEDGPAVVWWDISGNVTTSVYYYNGKHHRLDGPAIEEWYRNELPYVRKYFKNGKLYRKDGPAVETWYEDGTIKARSYYNSKGKLHRINGPAVEEWYSNGCKKLEEYHTNGKLDVRRDRFIIEWNRGGRMVRINRKLVEFTDEEFSAFKATKFDKDTFKANANLLTISQFKQLLEEGSYFGKNNHILWIGENFQLLTHVQKNIYVEYLESNYFFQVESLNVDTHNT